MLLRNGDTHAAGSSCGFLVGQGPEGVESEAEARSFEDHVAGGEDRAQGGGPGFGAASATVPPRPPARITSIGTAKKKWGSSGAYFPAFFAISS